MSVGLTIVLVRTTGFAGCTGWRLAPPGRLVGMEANCPLVRLGASHVRIATEANLFAHKRTKRHWEDLLGFAVVIARVVAPGCWPACTRWLLSWLLGTEGKAARRKTTGHHHRHRHTDGHPLTMAVGWAINHSSSTHGRVAVLSQLSTPGLSRTNTRSPACSLVSCSGPGGVETQRSVEAVAA